MNCKSSDFLRLAEEILARGNKLRFQAHGESMFPFIMDGDILEIDAVDTEIRRGDIIFYRAPEERIVAHRVIKKIIRENRLAFIVKGDSGTDKGEEVNPEQILGRVNAIERNKKRISVNQGLNRFMYIIYLGIPPLFTIAKRIGGKPLTHIQGLGIYRRIAKRFIKARVLYQWESDAGSGKDLLAKIDNVVIGKTNIDDYSKDSSMRQGWWIFGMWVHWRYRGLGIGKRLTEMACSYAAEHGATEVKLLIFKDNRPALTLYQKMGFYQISIAEIDEELREEAKMTHQQRIIMEKNLQKR